MTSNVVGAIAKSLKLSLVVKLVNFLINVLIVRYSSMPDLGKIHVNLQLVISACLFMLKEGFRKAALRDCSTDNGQRVIMLGVLATILVIIPCVLCCYTYVTGERILLMATLAAAVVAEVLAELPLFVHVATKDNLTIRNTCDMISGLVRSLTLIAGISLLNDVPLSFAVAQLSAAVSVLVISMRDLSPTIFFRRFHYPTALSYEMILMSFQKFFLAEGERMLSVSLLSADAIGQLALVNNVGSLVLRIIFAPIEDIASSALAVQKSSLPIRLQTLQSVFLIQASIGLLGLAFGPQSARAALHILYGAQWAASDSTVLLLQFYCLLLLLFAVNGTFEAYYFAIGDSSRIRTSLISQWFASAAFVGVAWATLSHYGPLAILMGNAASMILRSACCLPIFGSIHDPLHPLLKHVALRILAGSAASHLALFFMPLHSLSTASPARAAVTQCIVVGVVALLTLLSIRRPVSTALSSVKSSQA
jgi:oligosaccharide translocation protein RFT1